MDPILHSLVPYSRVFNIMEVGPEVLEYMSWTMFVAFFNADKYLERYAQHYVGRRATFFLEKLVGTGNASGLLAHLPGRSSERDGHRSAQT